MSDNENKPKAVLNELKGIHELLDEQAETENSNMDTDNKNIPILEQPIPELNERIDIKDRFTVSFNAEHSTETVEEQMARTRHEEQPAPPKLVEGLTKKPSPGLSDVTETGHVDISLVETPEMTEGFQYQQSTTLVESVLELQQLELEKVALNEKTEQTSETKQTQANDTMGNLVNTQPNRERIIEQTWIKTEMLLMENLPPQMSGALLQILNFRIEENKQQLMEDLSLLDDKSFEQLVDSLKIDQGF